tara:strand:+ start:3292 stop:4767 length:1476 start_codon:yes stop_codon:yes gene_type:complete
MAGFFGTSWDLGNSFNSPSVGNNVIGGNLSTEITPRPGSQGPTDTASMLNLWGAPTGYTGPSQQQGGMFNPYAAIGGGFYNPYQFGQVQYGTQYGGGQMPWWMNYNLFQQQQQPMSPVASQPQLQTPSRPQGTGPDGKDLTYDETIKYFGLYDDAESALAAGDKQAAYRKDHMQWRSGTGLYAGQGPGEGSYPGRPELGIAGDEQRMADLMGFPSALVDRVKGLFTGSEGNEVIGAQIPPMLQAGQTQPFGPSTIQYGPQNIRRYDSDNVEMALASGDLDPNRVEVVPPQDWRIRYPETQRDYNKAFERAENLFTIPSGANYFQEAGPQSALPTPQFLPDDRMIIRSYYNYPTADYSADSRFQPMGLTSALDNYKAMLNIEDKFTGEQVSPFGMTQDGMTVPVFPNIFEDMRDTSLVDNFAAEEVRKAEEAKRAKEAEDARKAAEAAAEKERQAAAAQRRMNDKYETGYVAPNIFTSGPSRRGSRGGRRRK